MKANEIETQLHIVHYSEQNQHFFFQTKYQDKQHTKSLMKVLVQEAMHITKHNYVWNYKNL